MGGDMIIRHTHTEAIAPLWKEAQKALRQYRDATLAFANEAPEGAEKEAARKIAAAIGDAGKIVAGKVPAAPVRHLRSLSRTVRDISAEVHGADPGAFCPLLLAEGMLSTDGANVAESNGELENEKRLTSHRCPVCLAPDVIRTAPKAKRDNPEARWHR
jgi:hypothetical protein